MGFGFNLIGFPLLILATVILLIYALRNKAALKILAFIWAGVIFLFIVGSIADYYRKPIRLTKDDVVGEYRIDTTFYPGKNSRWQYFKYKFEITSNDSIYFTIMNAEQKPYKVYRHKIKVDVGPPLQWSIIADSTYHVIKEQPTLHRSHDRFYYVFHSAKFGNMFFRRMK